MIWGTNVISSDHLVICAQTSEHRTQDHEIAVLLCGVPPGVGATSTAPLLDMAKFLERMLEELQQQGCDLEPPSFAVCM